jgi:pyruvate,orthophosphate dikinase
VLVSDEAVSIGGRTFALGSPITINGSTGEIFGGVVIGTIAIAPEAEKLRRWARELGIQIGDDPRPSEADVRPPDPPEQRLTDGLGKVTRDNVLSTLAIKGYVTLYGLAEALFTTSDEIGSILDGLIADGLVEGAADSFRLTAEGKDVASQILGEDRERWGADRSARALDSFVTLDQRMKKTVSAWQLREVDGSPTFNDHADPAYDTLVLGQLQALHGDALAWLSPIVASVARYNMYIARLDRAARLAADGDQRYVASPRVDSYHSIWFELHEDLILLSGRTRAEEVAAGRA